MGEIMRREKGTNWWWDEEQEGKQEKEDKKEEKREIKNKEEEASKRRKEEVEREIKFKRLKSFFLRRHTSQAMTCLRNLLAVYGENML